MAKFTPMFKGALGLNNTVDPIRLPYDEKTSMGDLAVAYNVDIDARNRVSRRPGWFSVAGFEGRDMFCEGGDCLFMSGSSLYKLNADYTRTGLRSGMTTSGRLSCAQAPDRIFYTNGFENGYVIGDSSYAWVVGSSVIGPTSSRSYQSPPVGDLVDFYGGRVFVATERHILWSEGFNWGAFDLARNFLSYGTPITMMKAVNDGIYVSDQRATYFISGREPKNFEQVMIAPYPAIKYTAVRIANSYIGGKKRGKTVVWTSPKGICFGYDSGEFENGTINKLTYPSCSEGTAAAFADRYIVLLKR